MYLDDGELFNPFSVGTSTSNTRYAYKQPKSPTYPQPEFVQRRSRPSGQHRDYDPPVAPTFPPPVYAAWPKPKKHTNRSVSQDSLVKRAADDGGSIKSQRGGIGVSKAINEEMAAAKQLKADGERIIAGGKSKSSVSAPESGEKTVTTLMAVRKRRSPSKSSGTTLSSHSPSEAGSKKSVHTQRSANKSQGDQAAGELDTRSASGKRTDSNITLKPLKGLPDITKSKESSAPDRVSRASQREDAGAHSAAKSSRVSMRSQADKVSIRSKPSAQQADNISRVSVKSKASAQQADNISRVSVKSKASVQQADNISGVSIKSKPSAQPADNISRQSFKSKASAQQADNISRVSVKSKASAQQADNISRVSIKSKANVQQADNISRVSIKSKANAQQADNISRVSIKSKANAQQADNISHVSLNSKASARRADNVSHVSVKSKASVRPEDNISRVSMKADNVSQVEGSKTGDTHSNANGNPKPTLKEVAEIVKKELQESMETTKSLAEKAALICDRLKAGNEFKHNRFHSLIRMYTNTEPLKRCREDRMSFWFKDAVLS